MLIPIIYRLVIDYKLCVTLDFSEVVQIYFTKPVRLKFGLIRVVAFGWCDLIRGCGLWLVCPYKGVWSYKGGCLWLVWSFVGVAL